MTGAFGMVRTMARDWRQRLKALIDERGLDMKNVSLAAGLGETGVRDLITRSGNPQLRTVQAVLTHLNLPLSFIEGDEGTAIEAGTQPALVAVTGDAAAGVWVEQDVWDTEKYDPVPIVPGRYASVEQRAWRIVGPSMDRLKIEDGDFVITVPYWVARTAPSDGDVVIVQRHRGQLVESTCKQVEVTPATVELWPRSTDKRFQSPYIFKIEDRSLSVEGESVEIIGLVIGKFRPM
jgi:SOS-response transcriptional repressor LexA